MVWVRSPVYFYKRNDIFYFSRAVPSDLRHRFNKKKVEVSLRTKSEAKAAKSAAALSDRLERYWDSLRMEMIYSRELGISVVSEKPSSGARDDIRINDALCLYQRLKGAGKTKLFFEGSERSIRYLIECVGFEHLVTRSSFQRSKVQGPRSKVQGLSFDLRHQYILIAPLSNQIATRSIFK